jgi:hypothetical protein
VEENQMVGELLSESVMKNSKNFCQKFLQKSLVFGLFCNKSLFSATHHITWNLFAKLTSNPIFRPIRELFD